MNARQEIIKKIGEHRGTNVLTYITADRAGINIMMEPNDVRTFKNHLDLFADRKPIDLFLFSNGGVSTTAWALVNLLREYTDKLTVLIPYKAFSCATSVAIGADEIIMSKIGTLGPIDPSVANEFNPIINGRPIPISVEDVSGFGSLAKKIFGINYNSQEMTKVFEKLSTDIRPLALGNAYRHYVKARDDAKKLLSLHTKGWIEKFKTRNVIPTLVEKLYFHGHHINRQEARHIGLKVKDATPDLEKLMWELYLTYEKDLEFANPYKDVLTTGRNIPLMFIESINKSDRKEIKQKITAMNFPQDAKLTIADGQPAVLAGNTLLAIRTEGSATIIDGKICDKVESVEWVAE